MTTDTLLIIGAVAAIIELIWWMGVSALVYRFIKKAEE